MNIYNLSLEVNASRRKNNAAGSSVVLDVIRHGHVVFS